MANKKKKSSHTGGQQQEGRISRAISDFLEKRENRAKVLVSKKAYILLALLLGIVGAHRFYARRWIVGALYVATFWCGISVAMSVIDVLAVIPMQPDENGKILL